MGGQLASMALEVAGSIHVVSGRISPIGPSEALGDCGG
jgi:hypothetical protein